MSAPNEDERWRMVLEAAQERVDEARDDEAEGTVDGYTATPLPIVEAECGWLATGLIWSGYSAHDQQKIINTIIRNVAASLLLRGWTPSADDAALIEGEQ